MLLLFCFASDALAEDISVTIRFLGGTRKTPIEGLKVSILPNTAKDQAKTLRVERTDRGGKANFRLPAGMYFVEIESDRELPFLDRPIVFKSPPDLYVRTIVVRREGVFEFNLADACRLTLRAVDVSTGKGLPGAVFVTENTRAELWALPIQGNNLGARRSSGMRPDVSEKTDRDGNFTRLIGPRHGYTYYVWAPPPGYEIDGKPEEVELKSTVGTTIAEHVFRFRKKK
ncbi:MAG: hypothetical protein U0840_25360 [Gemmataceae bacterium]